MKKMLMTALAALAASGVLADTWTDSKTCITWTYTVSNGVASVGSGSSSLTAVPKTTSGAIVIPSTLCGYPVTSIGYCAFYGCSSLTSITIPDGVTSVGSGAFYGCSSLKSVMIPDGVTEIGSAAFENCISLTRIRIPEGITMLSSSVFRCCVSLVRVVFPSTLSHILVGGVGGGYGAALEKHWLNANAPFVGCPLEVVVFKSKVPIDFKVNRLFYETRSVPVVYCYREYMREWAEVMPDVGCIQPTQPVVEYVSIKVRENDPTILDCVYRVKSGKPTVKVRALAFKDGVRGFANVVRPETFIEGTAQNIGDAVAANVEHKLSWRVSADWGIDLAKATFEVLATEDDLLPLELRTIPANGSNKAMEISWNVLTEDQVFSALLWLYADKDAGVTLSSGVLKNGSTTLASGASLNNPNASSYVFSKMGFSLLSGSNLNYVNTMSRLGLSPSGVLQYAYRWVEE